MFPFAPTKDKVLDVLLDNKSLPASEMIAAVEKSLPRLSHEKITDIIWDLHHDKEISVLDADNEIVSIAIPRYASSRLLEREEIRKGKIYSALIGYVAGFISGVLIRFVARSLQ